jgi:feruloyl esterase
MEAQRFPGDYDGIIAGAPAKDFTRLMSAFAWTAEASSAAAGSAIPASKLQVVQAAVLHQCRSLDPLQDGYLQNPADCRFDPAVLLCDGGESEQCLTAPQVATLRRIYQGPSDPRSGASFYPGFPPGGEAVPNNWDLWLTAADAWQPIFAEQFFRNMVYADPSWTIARFDMERSPAAAKRAVGSILDANDTDLAAFKARGGKLILFHGWLDAAIPPQATIDYYARVRKKMGEAATDGFVRLFMVPGMNHCMMGPGPDSFDMLGALEQWHERAAPPERIIATKYENEFAALMGTQPGKALQTRLLCPFPRIAHWDGAGSTHDAASFTCEMPRTINRLDSGLD